MGLEISTYINGLTPSWPPSGDPKSQGDDHIRLLKSVLQNTFPTGDRAMNFPHFVAKTASFSVVASDDETIFLVDTTAGNVVVTLPAVPATAFRVGVVKTSADANTVSVVGTVSGGTLPVLNLKDMAYRIVGNGVAYFNVTGMVIRDSSVTYGKMQNVAVSRLLGNPPGTPSPPSEISLDPATLEFNAAVIRVLPSLLAEFRTTPIGYTGFTLSTAGGSATFGIAPGAVNDVAFGGMIAQPAAYTKTTASWAVGSGNGALDTGSIAINQTYHAYVIKRLDTGVVDYVISLNASAPTVMPSGYTLKHRIGSMMTDASAQWKKFTQAGDEFVLAASSVDTTALVTGSRTVITLGIPTGLILMARMRVYTSAGGTPTTLITSLFENDVAANFTPPAMVDMVESVTGVGTASNVSRLTNTLAQVGGRVNSAFSPAILTYGWQDVTLRA